jgi:hypothetical protein
MHLKSLDVGLNNGRDYVQGSQMVACLVDTLDVTGREQWQIRRASFHKITNRMVLATRATGSVDRSRNIGHVSFSNGLDTIDFTLVETPTTAPNRSETIANAITMYASQGAITRFEYSCSRGFWPLLDTIVQACKRHIIASIPEAVGFMFTSLGANSLPLFPGENWASGRISIEELRRLDRDGVVQTMNRFKIYADDNQRCEGIFGFAFRREDQ